jgi:hypothetical protein
MLDLAGVHQPARTLLLQQVKRRLPVRRRGRHHHPGHTQAVQPVRQLPPATWSWWRRCAPADGAGPAWHRGAPARTPPASPCRYRARPPAPPARRAPRVTSSMALVPSGVDQIPKAGRPQEPTGTQRGASRVRNGNNQGPLATAPGVRHCYGLIGTKHHRRRRATHPNVHACRASPQGHLRHCCIERSPVRLPPLGRSNTAACGHNRGVQVILGALAMGRPPLGWASPTSSGSVQQCPGESPKQQTCKGLRTDAGHRGGPTRVATMPGNAGGSQGVGHGVAIVMVSLAWFSSPAGQRNVRRHVR